MMLNPEEISIVQWYPDKERHKCGYCKSENGSISYGMWASSITVEDYQDLIDRGWRRCGKYCYKPIMDETCCPLYTIRCDALAFSLSKSQKKVIKKFNKVLGTGFESKDVTGECSKVESDEGCSEFVYKDGPKIELPTLDLSGIAKVPKLELTNDKQRTNDTKTAMVNKMASEEVKKGEGKDPNKPPCKKAKLLRLERKKEKLQQRGLSLQKPEVQRDAKTLKDFLGEIPDGLKSKLKVNLVTMHKQHETFKISSELYKRYQMSVHGDSASECNESQFFSFLVETALESVPFDNDLDIPGFGSYHQQYWLDNKLIAVGVIDILPRCVSSVYFFYDPDYRNLTLGTYGSLREIEFTRKLNKQLPSIESYYMGFYIHSCPKMRYKGKLTPSYLLCPETYVWCPIEKCIRKLEVSKYSRLNDDVDALDENACGPEDIAGIKLIVGYQIVVFATYKYRRQQRDTVENVGKLIGKRCIRTMLFTL